MPHSSRIFHRAEHVENNSRYEAALSDTRVINEGCEMFHFFFSPHSFDDKNCNVDVGSRRKMIETWPAHFFCFFFRWNLSITNQIKTRSPTATKTYTQQPVHFYAFSSKRKLLRLRYFVLLLYIRYLCSAPASVMLCILLFFRLNFSS